MADRSRLATERMSVSVVRMTRAGQPRRVKFLALEGPMVVMIEADSEDEAHAICAEQALEFVGLCDDA